MGWSWMLDPGCAITLEVYVDCPIRASQPEFCFHAVTVGLLNTTGCCDVFMLLGMQQALRYLFLVPASIWLKHQSV